MYIYTDVYVHMYTCTHIYMNTSFAICIHMYTYVYVRKWCIHMYVVRMKIRTFLPHPPLYRATQNSRFLRNAFANCVYT